MSFIHKIIAKFYLKKPEQEEFIKTRYSSADSIIKEGINQIAYLLRLNKSFFITSLQIEVTNKCNLSCTYCPTNNFMKRKKGNIDYNFFKEIINKHSNVKFALLFNWGEPFLHPKIINMIKYIKDKKIKCFITTNSLLLTKKRMIELLRTDIDRITISLDGTKETHEKTRGQYEKTKRNISELKNLRDKIKSQTKIDLNMVINKKTEKKYKEFKKEWEEIVDKIQIQTEIKFDKKIKRKTRCKEPWRGNSIILWDGRVVPCCVDYEGEMNLGDSKKRSLKKIFNSKEAKKLRKEHNKKEFNNICKYCNEYKSKIIDQRFS